MTNSHYSIDSKNYWLALKISNILNGAFVTNVIIDEEFGNVTATVNNVTNVDCGFIEDYGSLEEYKD